MPTVSEFNSLLLDTGFVYKNNQQWANLIFACVRIIADASVSVKATCGCELCVDPDMVKTAQNVLSSIKNHPDIPLEVYIEADVLVVQLGDGLDDIYTQYLSEAQIERILNSGVVPIDTITKEEKKKEGYFSRICNWFTKRI